ncbi:mechanosensitive ion channel family protein [Profundibacter sp.]
MMQQLRTLFAIWAIVMSLAPAPVSAQLLPGFPGSDAETAQEAGNTDPLAEIVRQASESGATVIVIDPLGQFQSQDGEDGKETVGEKAGASLMEMQDAAIQFRRTLKKMLRRMPESFTEVTYILRASSPDGRILTFFKALMWSLVLLAVGILVERQIYGKRFARYIVMPRVIENPQGYSEKLPFLMFRFFMGVGGILVSIIVSYVIGSAIFGEEPDTAMQFTIAVIYTVYGGIRLVTLVWRMVLAPYLCQYRIPHFSNKDALKLYYWALVLATIDICALGFTTWVHELGLNYEVYALIASVLALVIALVNIIMVLVNRRAVSRAIRNGRPAEETSYAALFVSRLWSPVVILYFAYSWFELTYDLVLEQPISVPLIAGAYGVGTTIVVVYALINYVIEQVFARAREARRLNEEVEQARINTEETAAAAAKDEAWAEGESISDPAAVEIVENVSDVVEEKAATPYVKAAHPLANFEDLARRVSGVLAFVAGIWAILKIWDANMSMVSDTAYDRSLDVVIILFIAYIVYHTFRIWIDGKIFEEQGEIVEVEIGGEGGGEGGSRLSTLLPLFKITMTIVIMVTFALILFAELGINVSPLFAGAGVVGLAIGFGAQTLVRDIFSGVFFLFDDAFRKGEYIDTGDVKGTVEKISLRSLQLRHHRGPLNTIPFGEIRFLTNFSRDWVIMKLPLRVTYDTDPERVRKLIKKLGLELLEDPLIGPDFLQPLKSQGVIEMQDSAMIIRVKFMTKPGGQWMTRKRVLQDIRALFEREGIKFAHREVTVRLADGDKVKDLTPEQKEAVAGAALQDDEKDLEDAANGGDDR